jgi:plastocyanin
MDNGTLFYICGGALAVSAILVSFLGLKVEAFPGRAAPLVFLWFAVLVGAATSFSVLHAKDEEHAKAAEFSAESEKLEAEESQEVDAEAGHGASDEGSAKGGEARQGAQGSAVTLQLAASPTEIAYDKKSLSSRPGEVTIEFDNPAAIEHDVAIEQDGEEIAASDLITEGKTSVSADLAAGTYRFLCTVPGHAEAGMEGTLTVK